MKLKFIGIALLAIGLASCSQKVKVSDDDISGALEGAFEAVEGEYEVEKDENGNRFITVEIKRTDETVPYTDENISVFNQNVREQYTVAGFGYESYNKSDKQTSSVKPSENDTSIEEQLALLKLKPGKTGKLTLFFKDEIPAEVKITSDLDILNTGEIELFGSIGKYGIKNFTFELNVKDKSLSGQYQYLTSPAGVFLYLNGELISKKVKDDDYIFKVNIQESPDKFGWSGEFDGNLELKRDDDKSSYYYALVGSFLSYQLKTYEYNLKSKPIE